MTSISSDAVMNLHDRVLTLTAWCERVGISPATGRRLIKTGKGPKIVWLSKRRFGIRERNHCEWLEARERAGKPSD